LAAPFELFVVTPEREVWSGEATIVIARGTEGELAVMNGHAPVLVNLGVGPLFFETAEGRMAAAVHGGFLHVVTDGGHTRVDVLAEVAELQPEIDLERARQAREEAEGRLQDADTSEAQADLERAMVRLSLGT
jgi:F-type H+-transporting ATPase subunit epsilon